MFIQNSRIGGGDKGFQGESFFTVSNPPVGVTFTYYLKESIETIQSKRKKKETKLRKEGDDVVYPTLEELRKEKDEKKPHLVFIISDQAGNILRRIEKPATAGVQRVTWDYRLFNAGPINDSEAKKGFPGPGAYIAPGQYNVTLAKVVDGISTNIDGPVSFNTKTLDNVTLPARDRTALSTFQQKIGKLQSAIRTMNNALNKTSQELREMSAAVQGIKTENSKTLEEIIAVEDKIKILQRKINGDRLANRLDVDLSPSISDRVNRAAYGVLSSTSAPTYTQRDAYDIAFDEFEPLLEELKTIIEKDIKNILDTMNRSGAPYTLNRIPKLDD